MTDWLGNRSGRFVFRRVRWPTFDEAEDYPFVTSGSIERSALTDVKDSGSLTFLGGSIPVGDMVRIYYEIEGQLHPVATAFAACDSPEHGAGGMVGGEITLTGLLSVLADAQPGYPYTVPAGTAAVDAARKIAIGKGLRVNFPAGSSYKTATEHVFDPEDSYLTIVNWLLASAGYSGAWTDPYGTVQLMPYVEPSERPVSFEFRDGERSIILPQCTERFDYSSTPNVCRLYYEGEEACICASASNIDPDSPASLPNRGGRELTLFETVSELQDAQPSAQLQILAEMAKSKLIENSAEVEYVEFEHPWVPMAPNDAIEFDYSGAGISKKLAVATMSIDIPSGMCKTSARRFVRRSLLVQKGGAIY